jgi:hypothetical protein
VSLPVEINEQVRSVLPSVPREGVSSTHCKSAIRGEPGAEEDQPDTQGTTHQHQCASLAATEIKLGGRLRNQIHQFLSVGGCEKMRCGKVYQYLVESNYITDKSIKHIKN